MKEITIAASWEINAKEWIKTIENNTIVSRKVTSPAIFDTIQEIHPEKVLDLGCGEGWLTRQLNASGISAVGVDATEELIQQAQIKGGSFYTKSYEEIIKDRTVPDGPYEAVVFNFCLYQAMETVHMLEATKHFLHKRKLVIIQTLHPFAFLGSNFVYQDQWIEDSWKGLGGNFRSGHRWYYRTLEGWISTIRDSGLRIEQIKEPTAQGATTPSSILFVLSHA